MIIHCCLGFVIVIADDRDRDHDNKLPSQNHDDAVAGLYVLALQLTRERRK